MLMTVTFSTEELATILEALSILVDMLTTGATEKDLKVVEDLRRRVTEILDSEDRGGSDTRLERRAAWIRFAAAALTGLAAQHGVMHRHEHAAREAREYAHFMLHELDCYDFTEEFEYTEAASEESK